MLDGYGPTNIYLRTRDFSDIMPTDCGSERCRPGHFFGPAIRDYYLLHYVYSGTGIFQNRNGEHTVSGGQLFVIRPGEVTYYQTSDTDPWNYCWIGFKGNLASVFDTAPDVITADCSAYFDAIKKSSELESMREEYITGQLFLLFAKLFGSTATGHTGFGGFAQRAANHIESRYMSQLSVDDMAAKMNIDRRYLSRLFKREYGTTVKEYIVAERMKHALEFLTEGYTVGQTASMCGYSDVFNFSKMFKQYYGFPPSAARSGKINENANSKKELNDD